MKVKSERDFWSGVVFVATGVGFAIGASGYGMGPACESADPCAASLQARFAQLSMHPGPGFLPLGMAILLALLGVVVVFKSLTIESPGHDRLGAIAWRPLVVLVCTVAAFGPALEPLGLLLTVPAFVVLASFAGTGPSWQVVGMGVVLSAASWAVLVRGFGLATPLLPWFAR